MKLGFIVGRENEICYNKELKKQWRSTHRTLIEGEEMLSRKPSMVLIITDNIISDHGVPTSAKTLVHVVPPICGMGTTKTGFPALILWTIVT